MDRVLIKLFHYRNVSQNPKCLPRIWNWLIVCLTDAELFIPGLRYLVIIRFRLVPKFVVMGQAIVGDSAVWFHIHGLPAESYKFYITLLQLSDIYFAGWASVTFLKLTWSNQKKLVCSYVFKFVRKIDGGWELERKVGVLDEHSARRFRMRFLLRSKTQTLDI